MMLARNGWMMMVMMIMFICATMRIIVDDVDE